MSMWLDKKYIMLLGSSLERFKQKSSDLWNCKCPVCQDSKKNKNKTRGYILLKGNGYRYYCHNCLASYNFPQFLKLINPTLYDQYLFEKISDEETKDVALPKEKVDTEIPHVPLEKLKKISQLNPFDPYKRYIVDRQIPTPRHSEIYYCPAFKKFTNDLIPGKFESVTPDEARILLPIRNLENQVVGYQGRWLKDEEPRYITIMLTDKYPRLYNLGSVDLNRRYYCFEGPFDAMFINNSMAACGSKMSSELEKLNRMKHNAVMVYDNEPRNKDICNTIGKAIRSGYKVCIWPDGHKGKDINEMVLRAVSGDYVKTELVEKAAQKIKNVIDDNIFHGLEAELRLSEWRKA